ncbi:hypothetical protein [uncultured Sneathiella sp.]|uniref:hypothetical protein n=1 Tax=uncultured Sneathiella sp. TaxID=879315 RepID=UPI0030EF8265|tara:strand:- start:1783 stop:3852 length:2070 start_codon:yes stop_codon:yes gene_type:complete
MTSGRSFFSKDKLSRGFSSFNGKTIFLVDQILQLIDIKVLASIVILTLLTLGISYFWVQQTPQNIIFTPEQISYLTMPDTRVQATFYSFLCIAVFGFFLTAGLFTPNAFRKPNNTHWVLSSKIPPWLRPWLGIVFWAAVLIVYEPKARDFLLALVAAYLMAEVIKGRFKTRSIAIAALILIFLTCILPFGVQQEIEDGRLWTMDIHWSAVLGTGLYTKTAASMEFDAFAGYGVLLNDMIAGFRIVPFFETLGGTMSLLKLINVFFCALIIGIIYQRLNGKTNQLLWAAIILVLFVFSGMMSGVADTYHTPNLLPVRFLMVPVTVLLAYYLARSGWLASAAISGAVSPLFLFYNFETSIYCILALGFALFIQSARQGFLSLMVSGIVFAFCLVISSALFIAILFEGSLVSTSAELLQIMREKIESGSSGFAGLSAYLLAPFVIVMIHILILFSRYLISIKDKDPLSSIEFQNVVIVGLIIAIGPYVMNRFHILNMWIPFLLYTLLVLPKLSLGLKTDRIVWSFILILLIIPFIFGNPVRRVISKDFVSAVSERIDGHLRPCLDGINASPELCTYTLEKAEELKNLETESPGLRWISGLALNMVRLAGTQPALTQKAPFFFGHREETRNILVTSLRQLQAPFIAFDNATPNNIAGLPTYVEQFQQNLVRDAGYEIIESTKYWVIARKLDES